MKTTSFFHDAFSVIFSYNIGIMLITLPFIAKGSPLHDAATIGDIAAINRLIDQGVAINASNEAGISAMHIATEQGYKNVVSLLIIARGNVNIRTSDGTTPLHISSKNGDAELTKLLIGAGANVNNKRVDGRTPLHVAATEGRTNIVTLLLKFNADPLIRDVQAKTAQDLAEDNGYHHITNLISMHLPKPGEKEFIEAMENYYEIYKNRCPSDTRECPDGSFVYRRPPNCQFPSCETTKQSPSNAETQKQPQHPASNTSVFLPPN